MAYVQTRRRGLGAYPTDCFYDPNRPGWLPYWIDTPTESQAKLACFYGVTGTATKVTAQEVINPSVSYPPPPTPAVPPAPTPDQLATVPGNVLPGQLADTAAGQTQTQNQAFFNALDQSLNPPGGPAGLSLTTLIALGLVAGVGLLLATSGGGRRRR